LLGERIGEGYQVADDIHDATATEASLGKPVGRDEALGRPSAVRELGLDGAVQRLKQLVEEGAESIPDCPGRACRSWCVRKPSASCRRVSAVVRPDQA
jgi:geranylgeranyl diphosphate synthase type II